MSLSLCRHTDIQTTQYFSFGEFALAVGSCYSCSLFLIQFCLTDASKHWLPFTSQLKWPLTLSCSSSVILLSMRKNSSSRCGLYLWLFSRMCLVLPCYPECVWPAHSSTHKKIPPACCETRKICWRVYFTLLIIKGNLSRLRRCLMSKTNVPETFSPLC